MSIDTSLLAQENKERLDALKKILDLPEQLGDIPIASYLPIAYKGNERRIRVTDLIEGDFSIPYNVTYIPVDIYYTSSGSNQTIQERLVEAINTSQPFEVDGITRYRVTYAVGTTVYTSLFEHGQGAGIFGKNATPVTVDALQPFAPPRELDLLDDNDLAVATSISDSINNGGQTYDTSIFKIFRRIIDGEQRVFAYTPEGEYEETIGQDGATVTENDFEDITGNGDTSQDGLILAANNANDFENKAEVRQNLELLSETESDARYASEADGVKARSALQVVNLLQSLTSTSTTDGVAANKIKELADQVVLLQNIVFSDDSTLDELQEVVDYIKANRSDLENLSISNISGLLDALNGKATAAQGVKADNSVQYGSRGLVDSYSTNIIQNSSGGVNKDYNTCTEAGWHGVLLNNVSNRPATGYFYLQVLEYNNSNICQIAYPYGSDPGSSDTYSRTRFNGTWSAWRKVWDSGNLDINSFATATQGALAETALQPSTTGLDTGLATNAILTTDVLALTNTKHYRVASSAPNLPAGNTENGYIFFQYRDASNATVKFTSDANEVFTNTKKAGTWSGWEKVGGTQDVEGTFTPTLTSGVSGNIYSISTVIGNYVKIGKEVFIDIRLAGINTSGTPSGNLLIGNLPFTPEGNYENIKVGVISGLSVDFYSIRTFFTSNRIAFIANEDFSGSNNNTALTTSITNGTIQLSGSYITND